MSPTIVRHSIVIPTFRRPATLLRAIRSVRSQTFDGIDACEIVVVDNCPDASSRAAVTGLEEAAFPVRYVHEPRSGVSHARNAGIGAAKGERIVFIDDDEEAGEGWLHSLVETAESTDADVVFGPVAPAFEEPPGDLEPLLVRLYTRRITAGPGEDVTDRRAYLGSGNSLFRRHCFDGDLAFPPDLSRFGGEDTWMLHRLAAKGMRFCWAPGARVTEWVPPARCTLADIRSRRFRKGQIRTLMAGRSAAFGWARVIFWMGIGALQTASALAKFGLARIRRDRAGERRALIDAEGGIGKVLWLPRFRRETYGGGQQA